MSDYYLLLIIFLILLAALLQEDFIFTLIYLLCGGYILTTWWSRKAARGVSFERDLPAHAFLEEWVEVSIHLVNRTLLPVIWLRVQDSHPIDLAASGPTQWITSLAPRGRIDFSYQLKGWKRGYYPIGPLKLSSGDIFGLSRQLRLKGSPGFLTVYPKIIPLSKVGLPSFSPLGNLRYKQPIYEDPSRIIGKRPYLSGDSLRKVDWKATAATGNLQVKQYEPSIDLETAIFLDLAANSYAPKTRRNSTELGIVATASLASWLVGQKQSVGLYTNGVDPLSPDGSPKRILARKGRTHLMRVLELLARVQVAEGDTFTGFVRRQTPHLSWGTTMVLITGILDDAMFDQLFQSRRAGLSVFLVLCGSIPGFREVERKAKYFGYPLCNVFDESDLDMWR